MQINLKQSEIEAALKHFISSQGINLAGKTVEIAFTAGRKENGLTAEMQIEESGDIPGFTDFTPPAVLRAVPPAKVEAPTPEPVQEEAPSASPKSMFSEGEPVVPKDTAPSSKAVKLFL